MSLLDPSRVLISRLLGALFYLTMSSSQMHETPSRHLFDLSEAAQAHPLWHATRRSLDAGPGVTVSL